MVKMYFYSRSIGNRVSTSSDVDRGRPLGKMNASGDTTGNDTASDEDSQPSYSTTGSPTPNTNSQSDSNLVSNRMKSASSSKVYKVK